MADFVSTTNKKQTRKLKGRINKPTQRLLDEPDAAAYVGQCVGTFRTFQTKGWIRPFYWPGYASKRFDIRELDALIDRIKAMRKNDLSDDEIAANLPED